MTPSHFNQSAEKVEKAGTKDDSLQHIEQSPVEKQQVDLFSSLQMFGSSNLGQQTSSSFNFMGASEQTSAFNFLMTGDHRTPEKTDQDKSATKSDKNDSKMDLFAMLNNSLSQTQTTVNADPSNMANLTNLTHGSEQGVPAIIDTSQQVGKQEPQDEFEDLTELSESKELLEDRLLKSKLVIVDLSI